MSAIYGYSTDTQTDVNDCLASLTYWNRKYGNTSDQIVLQHAGLGCVLHHLTDSYPANEKVLPTDNGYAVMDAVLYNRDELAQKLAIEDIAMMSDEELLLRWVMKMGPDMLTMVAGDYAGAIYSSSDNTWLLFRDHLGVRPLYYYQDKRLFAFSTDLRGLTAISMVNTALNEEFFYEEMMGYNNLNVDRTEYEHIRCIPPAHYITVQESTDGFQLREMQYWKLGSRKIRKKNDEEYEKELCRLITEAVDCRARAVAGVKGVELSGGLDSSVISILLNRLGHEGIYYCWSLNPSILKLKERDERRVVLDICNQENITCHFNPGKRIYSLHTFETGIKNFDVPFINSLEISEGAGFLSHHGARMILSGYGGDEGVSHRSNLYELWYHKEFVAYFMALYRQTSKTSYPLLRAAYRFLKSFKEAPKFFQRRFDTDNTSKEFLNPDFIRKCNDSIVPKNYTFQYDPKNYIAMGGSRLRMDTTAVMGPEVGVQYMFPFLDYRVVDFAVSIPRRLYNDGITDRLIYRKAFRHLMPQSLYEVNYKHMPSLVEDDSKTEKKTTLPDEEELRKIQQWVLDKKKTYMDFLDKDYWKQYLDWDKLEQLAEGPDFKLSDYHYAQEAFHLLVHCAYLQNVGRNIKEHNYDTQI